ncbi:hypothetical protein MRX96_011078 [Rhipicephalus microplus]
MDAVTVVTPIPHHSASSCIRSASRAEKLGTLHKYAKRRSITADHRSSLGQAQVPTPAPGKGRRRKWRRGSAAAGSGFLRGQTQRRD